MYTADIKPVERSFLPKDFTITTWDALEPYFTSLLIKAINSKADLEQWLKDSSELEAVISEDACWRQVRMTCDTENKELEEAFNYFYMEIAPKMQPYADKLNRKLMDSPFTNQLDHDKYFTYLRSIKKSIELFREENIPINAELSVMQQQFGQIAGKMTVEVEGKEYTLQQAAKFLENPNRALREEVYLKIQNRRYADRDVLNELFNKLVERRHQIAMNAGFANYRDYKFKELGRFDYTPQDCFNFHEAVKQHVVPLVKIIYEEQKKSIGVDVLRPWDMEAEPEGIQPLQPFINGKELLDKSITCFAQLNPFFADCLKKMDEMKRFDLDSRKGKAPGGYNMPLAETGAPFIFMNAAGTLDDVTTMVHEGGHAVHSFLTHNLELTGFKEYGAEIAEVASMAMELFSMEHWHIFFADAEELRRAKFKQLERVLTILPWIARIDAFQHWIYENPKHTIEERAAYWVKLADEFSTGMIDTTGLEHFRPNEWQRQLHLFEVPFYYIEYGIAQLGAIGLWMQFKQNQQQALNNYINALSLGGTKTLPELYAAAGLKFDFSPEHIKTLMEFVRTEMDKLS
ncbi:M3 family oligoendopeptidase [Lacibacter sp. MH-610]|uniref:M3 family oligoendopeptidase n=1 Tax=Lacibacter sp. MH-610 TaxID=3020883 RepID=UPI0038924C62